LRICPSIARQRASPGAAFDAAWHPVKTSDGRLAEESHGVSPRELLAKRMVEMSQRGEKNRGRLVENALSRLALPSSE